MEIVRRLLKSKAFWAVTIVLGLVALYATLGFYVAPKVVRSQAIAYVQETYGRQLAIGEVRIHPFKLQAEIKDLALPDADGSPMIGFERLFVDFEVASLWERAFVFREVTLDKPSLRAVLHPDGSLNLADLATEDEEDSPTPAVWIKAFALNGGAVNALNQMRRTPIERHFAPVAFTLEDFRTTPEGGDFSLSARSQNEEQFEWRGRVALEPVVASSGEFEMRDLRVPGIAEFIDDLLPFVLPRGQIDLAGTYDIKLGATTALDVTLPKIEVSDLALRARGIDEDWVEIPSVVLADTKISMPANTVTLGGITVDGLKARAWFNEDGSLSTDQLFAAAPVESTTGSGDAPEQATAPSAPPAPPGTKASPAPAAGAASAAWTVNVGSVALRQAAVDFEDRTVKPAAKFALAPLNVTLRDASLDLAKPLPLEFDTSINGAATLQGTGQLVPEPMAVDVDIKLAGFAVGDLQPYANGTTDLTIREGTIDAAGRFAMAPPESGRPEMSFAGDVSILGFRSIDNALERPFLDFERVELAQLRFAMAPDSLSIDRVRVVKPFARVIISSDQVINIAAVFDPEGTAAAVAAAKAAAAAKSAEASRKKTRAELRAERQAAEAAAKARAAAALAPAPELKETGLPIRIREVSITGGTMDFADFSVQPNFAAAVQALGGTITGLSTDPNSRATVKLTGKVGEFSPVHIDGTTQPFAFDRYTDIALKFENISLPVFNPYSGKFAGYNIAKGKLTTDLHYQIDSRKLNAQHRIRIDQLEWGEATASKGEATLPVKFATSLLKDADGVISLDIPVAGTLDDPTFRIGPIVWQIIKNILTKAVTAPFKALGALFKGAEEAQFVDFAPGAAALDAVQSERLAALGKSLAPKEDLRLEVPIGVAAELDGKALAQARYEQELAAATATVLRGKKHKPGKDVAVPAFDALEPERKIDVLTALYTSLAGAPPVPPESPERAEGVSRKEAKAQAEQSTIAWLEEESRKRATALPGDLDQLAQQRAEAVQRALLTETGLAPERVFLARNGKVTQNESSVRFELAVK